ncbi:glycosyltransferase [Rheinheimera baltica]|uniref:Glycosyltransferase n=1 Tax=Rheinheimera baltica TaxID=67576 RepID=A0ABT9I414_9GAMM|nr:glycosyltransferase [Rheinheimera baltica]MDP5138131.1 glycosyltransferase [Rheinheimera baltica]
MAKVLTAPRLTLSVAGRVVYVVNQNAGYSCDAYSKRTHGVATALVANGHSVIVINRTHLPTGIIMANQLDSQLYHQQDDIRYLSLFQSPPHTFSNTQQELLAAVDELEQAFVVYKPEVVIATSNAINAEPAMLAAKRLKLPFYYDVRSFEELNRASYEPAWQQTEEFLQIKNKETSIAGNADKVITLNSLMRDELIARGVAAEKILLIPNGINQVPEILAVDDNFKVSFNIGYIGSFNEYEGLDDLLQACALLRQSGMAVNLRLIGTVNSCHIPNHNTEYAKIIQTKIQQLGISHWVIVNANVDDTQIALSYQEVDVVVLPRRSYPITELESSVEPIEAASYGKPVLLSDVAPNKLLVDECNAFNLFANGDVIDLAAKLKVLLTNKTLHYKSDAEKSLRWVIQHRYYCQLGRSLSQHICSDTEYGEYKRSKPQHLAFVSVERDALGNTIVNRATVPDNTIQGTANSNRSIYLSRAPQRYQKNLTAGSTLFVYAASKFINISDKSSRAALALIKFYDVEGNYIECGYGKLAFSEAFNAHYKYLPCTDGKISEIYQLKVPSEAVRVEVAFRLFNASKAEQVELSNVRIEQGVKLRLVQKMESAKVAFEPSSAQAVKISIAGWPDYPKTAKPYVMGIMDEFTTGCFEQDLNLIQPRPDNWYGLAEKYPPKLFFIESAWKGNMGSWQYRVAQYANKPGHEVAQICQYAKAKNIPTLFWNKEDPVHHDKFMESARLADYIFTTDANMISSYREKTGNTKVFALPFAAQPALHKPAQLKGRKMLSCFAGSWYGDRHAERGQVMGWLLDAANQHGLEIYDRNHGTGIFPFPQQYQHGIKGSLPYKALCDEYNRYRIFLNVNSVTDSPTMFSRRVFELMACGTPVVSTYAKGIEQLFDSDAVWMVNSPQEAEQAIHTLMTDDTEWRRRSLAGIREVFSKHTYAHRLNDIFATLGISSRMPTDPAMLLLAKADTADELRQLQQFAASQQYANFTLAIECSPALSGAAIAARTVLLQPGQGGAWLTQLLAKAKDNSTMLAGHFSAQCRYDVHYLRDLANASLYQPDATGWAKALEDDCFAFNSPALQAGTLWQAAQFAQQHLHCDPLQVLQQSDLFVADSDQFSLVGPRLGQVVGA